MSRSDQCFRACSVLSARLTSQNIPHAFSGGFLTVALGSPRDTEEIFCVAPGFKAVRQACANTEFLSTQLAPWSSRLYVIYNDCIPPVQIEVLPAGEDGPRNLDASTIMAIRNVPFLSVTEFVRAKLKVWVSRRDPYDAHDIMFILISYWESIDINRIVEQDMDSFVQQFPDTKATWKAIKKRYGP